MENQNVQRNDYGTLTTILKFVAALCLIFGFIAAVTLGVEGSHYTIASILWIVSGVILFLFWRALSVIVAACQKYLNSDKQ